MRLGTAIIERILENSGLKLMDVVKLDRIKMVQYANYIIVDTLIGYPSLIRKLVLVAEIIDEIRLAPQGDRLAVKPYLVVMDEEMRVFVKSYRRLKSRYNKVRCQIGKERARIEKNKNATSSKLNKLRQKSTVLSNRLESMRKRKSTSRYHITVTLVINGTY